MIEQNISGAHLHGRRLYLARTTWLVCAALTLLVLAALAPINAYNMISDWQVSLSYPAIRHLFAGRASYANYVMVIRYAAALSFLVTAGVIFWRKSKDGPAIFVSLTLLLAPMLFSYGGGTGSWWLYDRGWREFLQHIQQALVALGLVCMLTLFFIFPDGRFVPRWTRWVNLGGCFIGFVFFGGAFLGLDTGLNEAISEGVWLILIVTIVGSLMIGAVAQIYRYRHISDATQRQQIKWIVFGLALQPVWLAFNLFGGPETATLALINLHMQVLFPTLIPLTIGLSILRYRLWDIDVLINRALVYGALTAVVIGLYGLVVGALSALFRFGDNLPFSILVTGLIAVLFQPLRQRLQRAVNRLMYGERDDPATVLSRLGQRLESAVAPETVLATIVETIAQTLKLPYAAIALKMDERSATDDRDAFVVAAVYGTPVDNPAIMSLVYQNETVGQLQLGPRARGESFSHNDRRLLESIAHQAGVAAHAVRLTNELQHSRERLVTSREEERRRIRRDLHDGLGPTLASQALKLETALDLLTGDPESKTKSDPVAAADVLRELKTQTKATVAEIRRLVYELRPPALDEVGLVDALRQHVARYNGSTNGLQITIEAPRELPPLPAAVEVAAYRIALEAITNVVRHARAHRCEVRLGVDDAFTIRIEDDGAGLAPGIKHGMGLASMHERAAELGGICEVQSMPAGGTCVVARLPLGDRVKRTE